MFDLKACWRVAVLLIPAFAPAWGAQPETLRPPATPLITHDPYFSLWSMSDRLTDEATKHWTGTEQQLTGLARIDGKPYRFIGPQPRYAPPVAAMKQLGMDLTPTRTIYRFEAEGVHLDLTFFTPAFPDNLDVLSRPLTYLLFEARSVDARQHDVSIYIDVGAQLVVNAPEQRVMWSRVKIPGVDVLRMGTAEPKR